MSDMQKTDIRYCNTVIQMLEAELAAAQAQRDAARNDALEEAAKVCDEYANIGIVGARLSAAAIRATKELGK